MAYVIQARMNSDLVISISKATEPTSFAISSLTLKVTLTSAAMLLSPISGAPGVETDSVSYGFVNLARRSSARNDLVNELSAGPDGACDVCERESRIAQKKGDHVAETVATLNQTLEILKFAC